MSTVSIPFPIELEVARSDIVLELEVEVGNNLVFNVEEYKGETEFIPKVVRQEAQTKDKVLRANVSVLEIPKHEFDNDYGKTVVIGGIL